MEAAGRARAERTRNIWYMLVTLDVSKLSGWLNAHAFCRESKRGIRCGARSRVPGGGRRRAIAVHAVCRGGLLDCRLGAGHG